jgi:hypothetical protein
MTPIRVLAGRFRGVAQRALKVNFDRAQGN